MNSYGRRAIIRRIGPKRDQAFAGAGLDCSAAGVFSWRRSLVGIFHAVADLFVDAPMRVSGFP
jgi:hypothetical protein